MDSQWEGSPLAILIIIIMLFSHSRFSIAIRQPLQGTQSRIHRSGYCSWEITRDPMRASRCRSPAAASAVSSMTSYPRCRDVKINVPGAITASPSPTQAIPQEPAGCHDRDFEHASLIDKHEGCSTESVGVKSLPAVKASIETF